MDPSYFPAVNLACEDQFPSILSSRDVRTEPRWYVAQTCPRHEKRVAAHLDSKAIERFLPLYSSVSRWKDRRVRLELPLFAGYIFAKFPLADQMRVLETPGVVRLVSFGGLPVPFGDAEMETMRDGLSDRMRVEPHPFLTIGRRVRIKFGPLANLTGILVRKKGALRFVLSLMPIQRSVAAVVDEADIEPVD